MRTFAVEATYPRIRTTPRDTRETSPKPPLQASLVCDSLQHGEQSEQPFFSPFSSAAAPGDASLHSPFEATLAQDRVFSSAANHNEHNIAWSSLEEAHTTFSTLRFPLNILESVESHPAAHHVASAQPPGGAHALRNMRSIADCALHDAVRLSADDRQSAQNRALELQQFTDYLRAGRKKLEITPPAQRAAICEQFGKDIESAILARNGKHFMDRYKIAERELSAFPQHSHAIFEDALLRLFYAIPSYRSGAPGAYQKVAFAHHARRISQLPRELQPAKYCALASHIARLKCEFDMRSAEHAMLAVVDREHDAQLLCALTESFPKLGKDDPSQALQRYFLRMDDIPDQSKRLMVFQGLFAAGLQLPHAKRAQTLRIIRSACAKYLTAGHARRALERGYQAYNLGRVLAACNRENWPELSFDEWLQSAH